ncbi:hypothetical protein IQ03_02964 [Gemmobacter caeni]|uniref:Uncharacterized protein n=1 Tax=Gemmobacter caeni TaxID=589035 RepID=A0A2T6AV08_9RHOB|nr:hypothetical protein [Gemmobacter caeni]PTX47654.1 hypothetical protein C8N34_112143 [Gemmobacter caeni]TWI97845.1 hypothetical protein IQ03_02964 [Gemmobacter caeni]
MPLRRALVALLIEFETSLDEMEEMQARSPTPLLYSVLVRRRRAAMTLRSRLSRNDRPRRRKPAAAPSNAAQLVARETELLRLFDIALAEVRIEPELAPLLRSLRAEVEQARISLRQLGSN